MLRVGAQELFGLSKVASCEFYDRRKQELFDQLSTRQQFPVKVITGRQYFEGRRLKWLDAFVDQFHISSQQALFPRGRQCMSVKVSIFLKETVCLMSHCQVFQQDILFDPVVARLKAKHASTSFVESPAHNLQGGELLRYEKNGPPGDQRCCSKIIKV
jgi:hypothetical protein